MTVKLNIEQAQRRISECLVGLDRDDAQYVCDLVPYVWPQPTDEETPHWFKVSRANLTRPAIRGIDMLSVLSKICRDQKTTTLMLLGSDEGYLSGDAQHIYRVGSRTTQLIKTASVYTRDHQFSEPHLGVSAAKYDLDVLHSFRQALAGADVDELIANLKVRIADVYKWLDEVFVVVAKNEPHRGLREAHIGLLKMYMQTIDPFIEKDTLIGVAPTGNQAYYADGDGSVELRDFNLADLRGVDLPGIRVNHHLPAPIKG